MTDYPEYTLTLPPPVQPTGTTSDTPTRYERHRTVACRRLISVPHSTTQNPPLPLTE